MLPGLGSTNNPLIVAVFLGTVFLSTWSDAQTPKFTELSREEASRLDQRRAIVAREAKRRYGTQFLTRTKADLPVLQRLIDDKAFSKTLTFELQSLGVAFGDVLASELPLRWTTMTDEFGTDPTLRYKNTTVQVNALTMISQRVEQDRAVDLAELLRATREHLADIQGKVR